jgi:hypothetical protein
MNNSDKEPGSKELQGNISEEDLKLTFEEWMDKLNNSPTIQTGEYYITYNCGNDLTIYPCCFLGF